MADENAPSEENTPTEEKTPLEESRLDGTRRVIEEPLCKDKITMLGLGDWGKVTPQQVEVASALAKCAEKEKIDVVMSLGDNFYISGVGSVHDARFKTVYEDVYNIHESLKNIPFWGIAGNHDHLGNTQAQIDYSQLSTVWDMPALYYTRSLLKDDSIILITIDTTPFHNDIYGLYSRAWGHRRQPQMDWLLETMQSIEKNDQLAFIVGHHNMYTSSTNGKTGNSNMRQDIEQILIPFEKYIIGYVCGHEHVLCHYKPDSKIDHFVSGSGCMKETLVPPLEGTSQLWLEKRGIVTGEQLPFAVGEAGFFKFIIDTKLGVFKAVAIDTNNTEIYTFEKKIPISATESLATKTRRKISLRNIVSRTSISNGGSKK